MKAVKFQYNGKINYGAMRSQQLLNLPELGKQLGKTLPAEIEQFISDQTAWKTAEDLLKKAKPQELKAASIPVGQAKLLAPIASPPKILCLGLNYASHVNETNDQRPEQPVVFMKPATAIVGPNEKIVKRPFVTQLDYEGELAIVVGKKAKDVPVSEALNYIFGYTVLNDVSARDFQFKGSQWTSGKSFDTFAPIGPCITMSGQMPNTDNLTIKTWVNGELRQNGNTKDMIFSTGEVIYHLSRIMTLEPCDIIATGTPSGVGMAMHPPRWLKSGDTVQIEIDGIGTLENTVEEQ